MTVTGQPPQGPTATPPAVQAPAQGAHPWDNDLAFIEDESVRSQVSDYLGSSWQPRVTQLEQRSKPALEFLEEFQNEPGATTLGVIEEVYGEDAAKSFADYLTTQFGDNPPEGQQPGTEQPQSQPPTADPRLERMLSQWEVEQQERDWKAGLTEFQAAHPDVEIDDLLFRPFAAMTDGDLDQALVGYRNFIDTAKEKLGVAGEPAPEGSATQPPPALGTQGGSSPVPAEKTGQSIGDAIQDWVNDLKAQGQDVIPPDPNG